MSDTEGTKELEKAIEQTRAEVARDLGQVSERLSKKGLVRQMKNATNDMKERVVERARGAAKDALENIETAAETVGTRARDVGVTIKDELAHNPIAYGLIAAGIGWIAFDKIFGFGGFKPRSLASRIDTDLEVGDGGGRMVKIERGLVRYADSPMALGATAFVLGTALGVAVPVAKKRVDGMSLSH